MPGHFYNHFDPTQPYYDPLPENPTPEEIQEYARLSLQTLVRSILSFIVAVAIFALISLFVSCGTTRKTTTVERHRIETLMDRMDSLIGQRTVIQQDSAWRETIMRQFQSIREKSDTNRVTVIDTAGRVLKETTVINNIREVTSETDRQEREVLMHRLDVQDSTMRVMQLQLSRTDSLLRQRETVAEKPTERPLNWFQQLRLWLGNLVLVALAVLAVWWFACKHTWWLSLLRK